MTLLDQLEPRDRQLLRALLVLGVVALALIVGSQVITAFYFFGDIILVFFLAWLIAFVISPVVSWLIERIPALPPACDRPRLHPRRRGRARDPRRRLRGAGVLDRPVHP